MTRSAHVPQDWYIHQCPETRLWFLCQAGHDNNIAELFGTLQQNSLIAAAPELLAAAQLVIERWSTGDLADAVRQLDAAVSVATGEG